MANTQIINIEDLKKLAKQKLLEAEVLKDARHLDGAFYLVGYSVEFALKYRICKYLKWEEYRYENKEFNLKIHNFSQLILFTGKKIDLQSNLYRDWNFVIAWSPEVRYSPPTKTLQDAQNMVKSCQKIVNFLLK